MTTESKNIWTKKISNYVVKNLIMKKFNWKLWTAVNVNPVAFHVVVKYQNTDIL